MKNKNSKLNIEQMYVFCKKKGFVYPSAEIYGGIAGFYDYGPLGIELKNNIKNHWWKTFVQNRDDVVGMDGSIITNPKVWKASGHVDKFNDVYVRCKKCKKPNKLDKNEIGKVKCDCGGSYEVLGDLNLMFKTNVGPVDGNVAFLRPETAQMIFNNFKLIADNARMKLPFGIAQTGKAFRNEISPRDFLFRTREFEQMEIEFFANPKKINKCHLFDEIKNLEINFYDNNKKGTIKKIKISKLKTTKWHAYWIGKQYEWFLNLGINPKNLRLREHEKDELAHYASACFDIEYNFPFGWKEIYGNADRGQYDLKQHEKFSNKKLKLFDEETKSKIIPYVAAEPSQGIGRAFLAFLFDAFVDDIKRGNIVLNLHPKLSPIKIGVFSLVNKLNKETKKIYDMLKEDFVCQFDTSGSIGRRYARADEIGIPYCITVDFETIDKKDKKHGTVTIRDRDTTKQKRVKIKELNLLLNKLIKDDKFKKSFFK